jgi:hypothetical protein
MSEVTDDKDIQTVKYEKGSYSSTEEEISPTKLVKSDVEKKYVRKLNTRLLPLACMVIFLQVRNFSVYILSVINLIFIIRSVCG